MDIQHAAHTLSRSIPFSLDTLGVCGQRPNKTGRTDISLLAYQLASLVVVFVVGCSRTSNNTCMYTRQHADSQLRNMKRRAVKSALVRPPTDAHSKDKVRTQHTIESIPGGLARGIAGVEAGGKTPTVCCSLRRDCDLRE